jgi:hypothetical protein
MSVVTSIIIIFPYSEDERDRVKEINEFQHDGRKFHFNWIDEKTDPDNPSECYSGNKGFNSVVMLASYNNFPGQAFLDYIGSKVKWLDEDSVQVLINSEKSKLGPTRYI